ncbi:MAG: DEAD/DEAH box helicase family protein, partial [Mycobacteriales bacterium]
MLADDLAVILAATPGLTAVELAALVGTVSAPAVSFALFSSHERFRCQPGAPPRWWLAAQPPARSGPAPGDMATTNGLAGLRLYSWQADALEAWAREGRLGVIEAVTGTGKTMVGIAAALDELTGWRGQVLVLVPTAELAHQWVTELRARLPDGSRVGRLGAGAADRLATHDVLVAIVNSARALDVHPIRQGGLLIADECHRYGSPVNRLALDGRFRRRLGLSATYARNDDGNLAWLDPSF